MVLPHPREHAPTSLFGASAARRAETTGVGAACGGRAWGPRGVSPLHSMAAFD
jgi:hypothetical protein